MKFRQFIVPQFLRSIGREKLGQLFGRFAEGLNAAGLTVPAVSVGDDAYFRGLACLALSPEGLPDELIETLFVIEEMANPAGQEALETAAADTGLQLDLGDQATPGDIAVQVWLANPDLLVGQHNRMRLGRLSAFRYYVGRLRADHPPDRVTPSAATIETMTADLDHWFRQHNRGRGTTRISVHELDEEFWFLILHGDTFRRTTKVDGGRLEVLHFRQAKDDVVVFSPLTEEIRIHAGTKGERELYRRTFGAHLRGDSGHFREEKAYTLEPLRTEELGAVHRGTVAGIVGVALREVEIARPGGFREFVIRKAEDVFLAALVRGEAAIPNHGDLVRAVFDFQFERSRRPRRVEVRTPNTLRVARHCDARLVHRWLAERGFHRRVNGTESAPGVPHV